MTSSKFTRTELTAADLEEALGDAQNDLMKIMCLVRVLEHSSFDFSADGENAIYAYAFECVGDLLQAAANRADIISVQLKKDRTANQATDPTAS